MIEWNATGTMTQTEWLDSAIKEGLTFEIADEMKFDWSGLYPIVSIPDRYVWITGYTDGTDYIIVDSTYALTENDWNEYAKTAVKSHLIITDSDCYDWIPEQS